MTVPWSLTITAPEHVRTISGLADTRTAATAAALDATRAAVQDARASDTRATRYELRAEDAVVAIIQSGADPDDTEDLVERLITQHRADGSLGRAGSDTTSPSVPAFRAVGRPR
ncbi:hypothetical protein P5V34_04935 [Mycobacteroides abscessus subsp. abscessus]|jgi:hypothetical protein|uniref:hypothetical protein n=1 Tax=Mycobacteroides abscessus TaxID=36809 RepID=UPI00266DAAA0|nr:hypothetical protein [Mycobacteroides abscessus]MDO3013330.1 hypothetical protein [Mycobacteroides abscessus subsp. abscessus]